MEVPIRPPGMLSERELYCEASPHTVDLVGRRYAQKMGSKRRANSVGG